MLNDGPALAAPPAGAELRATEEVARRLPHLAPASRDTRQTRLAFWINVYSALALHAFVALGVGRSVWQSRASSGVRAIGSGPGC